MTRSARLALVVAALSIAALFVTCVAASAPSTSKQVGLGSADTRENQHNRDDGASVQTKTIQGPSDKRVEVNLKEELVYGLTLFMGTGYRGTFCPEEIDTIHIIADVRNVMVPTKTKVYFWPITREYMADWFGMDEKQEGVLEILRGQKTVDVLPLEKYVLQYPEGVMDEATSLKVGRQAEQAARAYKNEIDLYYQAMTKYYQSFGDYRRHLESLLKDPQAFGARPPTEPEQPSPPKGYVTDIERGFIVDLPPGQYTIRLKSTDGRVIPGTTKKVISFPLLARGIGYQIIPEEKWTYPTNSNDLRERIYALGGQIIYLKPFEEHQYNSFHYTKLSELTAPLSGRGMENQTTWVHVNHLDCTQLSLGIARCGKIVSSIQERPYWVQQRSGTSLGYDIIEEPPGSDPLRSPAFTAYKIEVPEDVGTYTLRLVDENGRVLEGSVRTLHVIQRPEFVMLLCAPLAPVFGRVVTAGVRMLMTRCRRRSKS